MQDFKYFTYGYNPDLRNPIYGLYQPVLNCFLIVFPDYDTIVGPQLTAILSSRYLLQPVQLNTADNYTHNIIDNEICENWTISNLCEIPTRSIITKVTVVPAARLIPTSPITGPIQLAKEKQWAQFCLFWLRFINTQCYIPAAGVWIDNLIGNLDIFNIFDPLLPDNYKYFITTTIHLLYLGQDMQTTEQAIIDIVNTNDSLKYKFEQFLKKYNE